MTRCAARLWTVALVAAASVLVAEIAWGAGVSVSSARLGVGTLSVPSFHPTALTISRKGKAGGISKGDELIVTFSGPLQVASICPGLPQQATTVLNNVIVSLADGGATNDQMTVTAGPLNCLLPRIGSFDLGATTHATGLLLTFTASQLTITQAGTITVLLGNPTLPVPGSANGPTVVRYTPHASVSSSTGQPVSGLASTVSAVHF